MSKPIPFPLLFFFNHLPSNILSLSPLHFIYYFLFHFIYFFYYFYPSFIFILSLIFYIFNIPHWFNIKIMIFQFIESKIAGQKLCFFCSQTSGMIKKYFKFYQRAQIGWVKFWVSMGRPRAKINRVFFLSWSIAVALPSTVT